MPHVLFQRLLVALLSLSLVACSTLRTVPEWRQASAPGAPASSQAVRVGDEVRVKTASASPVDLTLTAVEADALAGNPKDKSPPVRIAFDQIVRVERMELDVLKVAGLVVVGLVVLLGVALKNAAFFPPPP